MIYILQVQRFYWDFLDSKNYLTVSEADELLQASKLRINM